MPLFTFLNINHHEKEEAVSDKSLIATEPGSRDLFAPIKNSRQFDAPKQTKTFLKVSKPQADNSRGSSVEQRNKQRTVASSLCDCLGIVSDELSQPPLLQKKRKSYIQTWFRLQREDRENSPISKLLDLY